MSGYQDYLRFPSTGTAYAIGKTSLAVAMFAAKNRWQDICPAIVMALSAALHWATIMTSNIDLQNVAASQLLQMETAMPENTSSSVCLESQIAIFYNLFALACLVYLSDVDYLLYMLIDTD